MFSMLNQIFRTIALFFSAGEKLGITLNNLGTIGVEMSASYADEQRVLRQAKLVSLNKEHSTTVVPAITAE